MEHLSNDILSEIINFCDCQLQTSIWVANKKLKELFFKYNSCNILKYKKLCACEKHSKCQQKINVIHQLGRAEHELDTVGFVSTIHFRDLNEMKMGDPYLARFGKISHKCCQGVGVMYDIPLLDRHGKKEKKRELTRMKKKEKTLFLN